MRRLTGESHSTSRPYILAPFNPYIYPMGTLVLPFLLQDLDDEQEVIARAKNDRKIMAIILERFIGGDFKF